MEEIKSKKDIFICSNLPNSALGMASITVSLFSNIISKIGFISEIDTTVSIENKKLNTNATTNNHL
jgi:hypothetical protein